MTPVVHDVPVGPPTRSELGVYAFARAMVAGFSYLYWRARVSGSICGMLEQNASLTSGLRFMT